MIGKIFTRDFWSRDVGSAVSADGVVTLLILGFVCFHLWFGAEFHYVEECYSSEYDRYVEKADSLRDGTLPRDPYHPLFYPLLAAGLGQFLGNTFAAARVISSLAGAWLLLVTYHLARRCFGLRSALAATLWLACNSLFLLFGFMTTTDMLFSALALSCLYFSVRATEDAAVGPMVLTGVCFGLAYCTRYAAMALIPNILWALWSSPFASIRRKIRAALLVTAVIVCTLAPHFIVNTYQFGSPFYSENSKNLVRKVFGVDLERDKPAAPLESVASVVLRSPGSVAASAVGTADTWIAQGALAYVAGNKQFLAAAAFAAAFLAGAYLIFIQRERRQGIVLIYAAAYFAMICLFMEPFPRLVLPILPVLLMTAAYFIVEIAFPGTWRLGRIQVTAALPPVIILCALVAWGIPPALSESAVRHPYQEVEAAQLLQERAGTGVKVMGSFPFMQRYVQYRYDHLNDDGFLAVERSKAEYFERLRQMVRDNKANFLIFGRASLGNRPPELLSGLGVPPFLKPVFVADQAAVYKVVGEVK
jgi:hypothetical protein